MSDWLAWHADYDAPGSALAQRLAVVRRLLDEAVASHDERCVRVLSICAGDGRDLLPVLGRWRARKEISGRLIELEPELAERARAAVRSEDLHRVEVVCADAASPMSYAGALPADLVVACGVFGNISEDDVHRLVASLATMCAAGADVIWTRHRRHPDLTPRIREWFTTAGFEERAFCSPGPERFSVGRHTMVVSPPRRTLHEPLFTFIR